MKKLTYLCVAAVCLLAGCQHNKKIEISSSSIEQPTAYIEFEQRYPMTLADGTTQDVTEKVKMAKEPQRVIVLDMATLDSLYAVNIYKQIVGIRANKDILHHLPDNLRREFTKKQYVSVGDNDKIDFDAISRLAPEAIFIGRKEATEEIIHKLQQAAPKAKIIYSGIDNQDRLTSLTHQSELLGHIFNKTQLYQTFLKNINLDVDYIRQFDKKDLKLAVIDIKGQNVKLTSEFNEWFTQLDLSDHIYMPASKDEATDMYSEEVANQRILLARESATEDEKVVASRQQEIDKEKQLTFNFDKNIEAYQPTAIMFVDDVLDENKSNMPTILFSKYMSELSAIKSGHYRIAYATEWKTVNGGVYSYYTQVEDIVKLLQKTKK